MKAVIPGAEEGTRMHPLTRNCPQVMIPIGNAVGVKASIIMDRTHVGHLSSVCDSIIGTDCNFGAGTKVTNLTQTSIQGNL